MVPIRRILLGGFFTLFFYWSGFLVLFTPLPLFYLSIFASRPVWRWTAIFVVGCTLLFYLFLFPRIGAVAHPAGWQWFGVSYLLIYLGIAAVLSLGARQDWVRWFGWGGAGVVLGVLAAGGAVQALGLFDLQGGMEVLLEETAQQIDLLLEKPELARHRPEALPFLLQSRTLLFFLPKLLPALLFIFTVLTMALNVLVLRRIAARKGKRLWTEQFRQLRLPVVSLWVLLGSGFLFFLNDYTLRLEALKILALNGVLIGLFVYFLQGLSIFAFILKRFSPLFRWSVYGLVFLFLQLFGLVVVGIGVADVWFDFRKLERRKPWKSS